MKRISLLAIVLMLAMMLTACLSAEPSTEQAPPDSSPQTVEQGAPPAEEFSTAEEAIKRIKEVKAAGPENVVSSNHVALYDKDYIYLLNESPLPGFEQAAIMLVLEGTAIIYQTDEYEQAWFFWDQGETTDKIIDERMSRFNLKRFEETKFYIGELHGDARIYWWENGEQFSFAYPTDTNIAPEDVIERLEVEKYDL